MHRYSNERNLGSSLRQSNKFQGSVWECTMRQAGGALIFQNVPLLLLSDVTNVTQVVEVTNIPFCILYTRKHNKTS